MATVAPILITADEINCLIHAYFEDSGFQHSAFCLRAESKLETSPNYTKHVRRGELVDLLSKALLYVEVEAHWSKDAVTTSCQTPFTLLDEHRCSADAKQTEIPVADTLSKELTAAEAQPKRVVASNTDANKRKAPERLESDAEKRARTTESTSVTVQTNGKLGSASTSDTLVSKESYIPLVTTGPARIPSPPDDPWAIQKLTGHKTEVFVCAWNPARPNILATGDKGCVVNIWDIQDPPPHGSTNPAPPRAAVPIQGQFTSRTTQGDLTALDWNKEGTLLAVASYDCVLRVLSADGSLFFSSSQHKGPIFAVRFSNTDNRLLTGSLDGTACVWDMDTKKLITMYRCHVDCCLQVEWLEEGIFATCGADKLINIIRVGDTRPMKTLTGHTNEVNMVRYHPSSKRLASCSDDRTARVWDLGRVLRERSPPIPGLGNDDIVVMRGHKNNVGTMDWCPTPGPNPILATSGFDGTVRLWDSSTGDPIKVFSTHKTPIFCMSFSPDGRLLASGGGDGKLIMYDIKKKEVIWTWLVNADTPGKDGVFEIDWQEGPFNRLAVTLESQKVAVIDPSRIPQLQDA